MCLSPWQIFYGYEVIIMSSCHIGMMSVLINLFYRPVLVCLVVGSVTLTLCQYGIRVVLCTFVVWHIVMWITLWKKALTLWYILRKFLMSRSAQNHRIDNIEADRWNYFKKSEKKPWLSHIFFVYSYIVECAHTLLWEKIWKKVKKSLDFLVFLL